MAPAISNSFDNLFPAAASGSTVAAAVQEMQPASSNLAEDTVRLTQPEQVQQLYSSGHTVPQIAFQLSLSYRAVDQYLNISNGRK